MRLSLFPRSLLRQRQLYNVYKSYPSRAFHASVRLQVVKPLLLADIGEGIRECEIIQWFVEPAARVEEFDKICEVQSDKASVEITTRFTGVIKKLHYDAGEMAIVGKPLVDIDVEGEVKQEDLQTPPALEADVPKESSEKPKSAGKTSKLNEDMMAAEGGSEPATKGTHASLATPAVRHLTKELGVNIEEVTGTGRDGRVLKDDVHKFAEARKAAASKPSEPSSTPQPFSIPASDNGPQKETTVQLTNVQSQMFKTMTASLRIPHFLYADEVDFTTLTALRRRLNKPNLPAKTSPDSSTTKLSFLPFIIKALSLALYTNPILNARVDTTTNASRPTLIMRSQHNIGIAMDTPSGLLVPVIHNVSSMSIAAIAAELQRLQALATAGKLTTKELTGGTITVSNIGSIGGTVVSPIIVEGQVAILGIGKVRGVPAFERDGEGKETVVRKEMACFSWSADHRVVDGATMARAAEVVRKFVEAPDRMMIHLR